MFVSFSQRVQLTVTICMCNVNYAYFMWMQYEKKLTPEYHRLFKWICFGKLASYIVLGFKWILDIRISTFFFIFTIEYYFLQLEKSIYCSTRHLNNLFFICSVLFLHIVLWIRICISDISKCIQFCAELFSKLLLLRISEYYIKS